jgi:uncharacterized protein
LWLPYAALRRKRHSSWIAEHHPERIIMAKQLHMSDDFSLPLDITTQAIGLIGKRRAGKSTTARRITEQLLKAGQQVVVVDPKGDWWGLRSSRDGTEPGLPILVLGGEHGDLPLEPNAGELIAQFVVEENVSCVLDLGSFRKGQVAVFMAEFLETLYRLKQQERYRTAMMLVIDEADAIAPQKPMPDQARMLGAAEDIVRRGGQRGIGCTMATQRASILNKNVLNMIEVLVMLRTIAPLDLAAVEDWVNVHGTPEQRKELMASLPSLPIGTAWFWSPGWPTDAGIFQRVRVDLPETYDSSATPKPGERRTEPKHLADVDLSVLRERMAEAIERAAANDPKRLRQRIAELERELKAKHQQPMVETKIEQVEVPVPVIDPAEVDRLLETARTWEQQGRTLIEQAHQFIETLEAAQQGVVLAPTVIRPPVPRAERLVAAPSPRPALQLNTRRPTPDTRHPMSSNGTGEKLPSGERKVLTALAQHGVMSKRKLAILTGYAIGGGGFNNILSSLRSKQYIVGSQEIDITDAGLAAMGSWQPLPTGQALVEHWLGQLGKAERAILEELVAANGTPLGKVELAASTGYAAEGGGFNNALSRLRTLELIHGSKELIADEALLDT